MVRCIPTFVILGLIASLTCNHPISIDNVDEIVETVGVQAVDDVVEDVFATTIPYDNNKEVETVNVQSVEENIYNIVDNEEVIPTTPPLINDTVDIEEPSKVEENSTAGVQAVEDIEEDVVAGIQGVEDVEEDNVVGIQGVEDVEEDDIVFAEATPTAATDNKVGNYEVFEDGEMEFELIEEGEEADDETAATGVINEEINTVQSNAPSLPNAETAAVYENLALEALNRLKILHIFRSFKLNKPNKFYNGMKSENESEHENDENIVDVFESQKDKNCVDERCEAEDNVEVALFEVEAVTDKNDFETVTEIVTDVHVVSAIVDDDDQPTIGAIAIDPVQNQDIDIEEEEVPLFGVIVEIDDEEEVQIAKESENSVDDDQPTIGSIAIDPVQKQGIEEEEVPLFVQNQGIQDEEVPLSDQKQEIQEEDVPLFGVVVETDDDEKEVQIAKKDKIFVDDNDQPAINATAIDIQDEEVPLVDIPEEEVPLVDIPEEEVPLFGVIVETDNEKEVQIAKEEDSNFVESVFVEVSYEIVDVTEQQTPVEETTEETTESLVISGVLIDLTEQEKQSEAVATEAATEAATDVVEEEPTIIN